MNAEYLRDRMGSAVLDPSGPIETGSLASFVLVYTAGFYGIDDTGGIKVSWRLVTDQGRPQFRDPAGPNYTTAETTASASLELGYDTKDNVRPWDKTLRVRVAKGHLQAGDRIILRFGDTRKGSPGFRVQTFAQDSFEFKVFVDAFATCTFVELPRSPAISIVPGPPAVWKLVLPSARRRSESFRLGIIVEDVWGNPTQPPQGRISLKSTIPIEGLSPSLEPDPGHLTTGIEGLRGGESGEFHIEAFDSSGGFLARSNPMRIVDRATLLPFWGDLHGQSGETIGTNSARKYFAFASEVACLDVCGHQANDFQIGDVFWRELNEITAQFNQPHRFVTLPGYEWSGNTGVGGDRNVYLPEESQWLRRSSQVLVSDSAESGSDCATASELLTAAYAEGAIIVAHVGGRYADIRLAHDGRVERSVEIHSGWGTFEWLLEDAFLCGYRVGIVCNSDEHKGRPGASYPGVSMFGAYGGLTCLLSSELTRPAVLGCLKQRHHYGTTGARIILNLQATFESDAELFEEDPQLGPTASRKVRHAMMGDIVRVNDDVVKLTIDVKGTAPIERVAIRCGADSIETIRSYSEADLAGRIRVLWQGAEYRGRTRQTNWDGVARFKENKIIRFRPVNFWNPDKKLIQVGGDTLSWSAITTGTFGGFDVWLQDRDQGTLEIATPLVTCSVEIASIGMEEQVFDAGGISRRLSIFRLPADIRTDHLMVERRVSLRRAGDTPLFVNVKQEDGHQAWSSPMYLFR